MPRRNMRSLLVVVTGALLWNGAAGSANAQYQYVGPGGPPGYYPPGGYYPGYGPGSATAGYWYGSAAALDAYGNLGVSQEQARILREQSEQAKLVTAKQKSDTNAYLRANKYWYTDEKVDTQTKVIQAAMNNPPAPEITSGRALNTLLNYIDKMMAKGFRGPTVTIDPAIVKQINVSAGSPDNGNIGVLKDLAWPSGLEGDLQKEINAMLEKATADAARGAMASGTANKLRKATEKLDEENKKRYRKGDIDGVEFIEGNRFIDRLRSAELALQQPTAGKLLSGVMGPQGDTVDEVVQSMIAKGLMFAQAPAGRDYAYQAVYRAFVNYAINTDVPDTGFRLRISGGPNAGVLDKQAVPQYK
jgi:hypothetical protein